MVTKYLVKFIPEDQLQGHQWVLTEVDGTMIACVALCLVAANRYDELARALSMAWQAYREICGCPHTLQSHVNGCIAGPRLVPAADAPYPVTVLDS